jgi:hypothetical protein
VLAKTDPPVQSWLQHKPSARSPEEGGEWSHQSPRFAYPVLLTPHDLPPAVSNLHTRCQISWAYLVVLKRLKKWEIENLARGFAVRAPASLCQQCGTARQLADSAHTDNSCERHSFPCLLHVAAVFEKLLIFGDVAGELLAGSFCIYLKCTHLDEGAKLYFQHSPNFRHR